MRSVPVGTMMICAVVACGSDVPSGSDDDTPTITAASDLRFTPAQLNVGLGETVDFNFGSVAHTVKFDVVAGRPSDIANATANAVVSRTFSTAGSFGFGCTIHPAMRGSVVVSTTLAPPPPPPPPSPY